MLNHQKAGLSRQKHDFSLIEREVRSILLKPKSRSKSRFKASVSKAKRKTKLIRIVNNPPAGLKKAKSKSLKKSKKGRSKSKGTKVSKLENGEAPKNPKAAMTKSKKKILLKKPKNKREGKARLARKDADKIGQLIKHRLTQKKRREGEGLRLADLGREKKKLHPKASVKQILKITQELKKKTRKYGVEGQLGGLVDELRQMVKRLNGESSEESQNKSSSGNVMNYNINNFQNINNIKNLK